MRIYNTSKSTDIATDARAATGFWSRLVGLLGRSSLRPGQALVLEPCRSIHTAFMRFEIDVIYLDRSQRVVKLVPALKPFRLSGALRRATAVIELPSGTIANSRSAVGDHLVFRLPSSA